MCADSQYLSIQPSITQHFNMCNLQAETLNWQSYKKIVVQDEIVFLWQVQGFWKITYQIT